MSHLQPPPHPEPDPIAVIAAQALRIQYPIPPQVLNAMKDVHDRGKRVVVMTCGIAGSGKSTLARNLEKECGFVRLSIDKRILETSGVIGVDYPPQSLSSLQDEAEAFIHTELKNLLSYPQPASQPAPQPHPGGDAKEALSTCEQRDVVLDLSLYLREDREFYRNMVKEIGSGRWESLLVVFQPRGGMEEMEDVLWGRIEGREREGERGGEGMSVNRDVLGMYLRGFEWPDGEGEVVVDVK